jgi:hypothetical protein
MSRYRSNEAVVWIWDDYDRTCLKWRSNDYWDEIRQSLKAYFPRHGDLSYSGTRKLWSVPVWRRPTLEEWLLWTFEPAAIMWDEEPPGPYGRTYRDGSYGRYSRPRTSTSSVEAAFAQLHLLPSAPAWAAEAVYRAAIKVHHPDAGGDGQTMTRINLAMERIREHQERERKAS